MRFMGDSTTASDIPQSVDMVAGYRDGPYKWSDADWALFAGKPQVGIVVDWRMNDGDALDIESGDSAPDDAPVWVAMRRATGHPAPACYVNPSNIYDTRLAFINAGVPEPLWWLAHYDNQPVLPTIPNLIAKQFANEAITGGHYDLSVVADYWPGVDQVADQFVTKAEFEQYKIDLQKELVDNFSEKGHQHPTEAHSHSGTVTAPVTVQ